MKIVIPNLVPGATYALQFRSKNATQVSNWSRTFLVEAGKDTIAPATPTGLAVSTAGDSFLAEWIDVLTSSDGSQILDFSHYNVKIRNVDNDYTVVMRADDNRYELTYNLNVALFTPVAGTVAVSVSAVDITGNASPYTAEITVQNPPPGPVQNLTAVGGYENITTNWQPPANLEGDFKEYRLFVVNDPSATITNQSLPVWQGQGTSYVYATSTQTPSYVKVVAVDKFNSMSTVTTAGPVTPKLSTSVDVDPPAAPTSLAGSITGNELNVTWTAPTGTDLSGYQIAYRKVGATEWSYVSASHEVTATKIVPIELYKNYEVKIWAHDTSFNYSAWSPTITVNGAVNTAPAAVTGLVVKGAITSAIVTWNKHSAPDVVGYEVQFKASSTPVDTDPIYTTSANIMGFSENVSTDTMYYARVRAVDDQGLKSPWTTASGAVGFVDFAPVNDRIDDSITGSVVEYSVHSSETVAPTTGWSTDTPTRTPGTFIWYRTKLTYGDSTTTTSNPAVLTGPAGAAGTPAATISLTATTQVLTVPATGGATNPTTAVVTGSAVNTSISVYEYSVNGAAFSATVPAGVSRSGNVVTITGSTMTAKTITVRMADAAGIADTLTVAKVSDGATGGTGSAGADAYTVLLSNESHAFPGSTTAALAGSTTSTVIAYKGTAAIAATVGTITGQVTGLTTSIANNGTTAPVITITVTTALTALSGTLVVPVTVDGKAFTKNISWTVARQGAQGGQGIPGTPGADGTTYYTWLKYASSATPAAGDMSDSPTGKTYMGIAVNKTSATESTNYADYTWSLIQGEQGIPGTPGADGTTTYTWVKYADSPTTGMSDLPTGKTYIGLAFNKTTATETTNYGDYQWSLIQGPQGDPGAPAPVVSLTATTQVLTVPATGGATTPTTAVVTGTAANTTISVWEYSANGAAFAVTVPAGVSRTGNVVTITGSTMTAKTITVRMADAAGVADTMTVAKVAEGAAGSPGSPGTPGADAYTVLLTNESHAFAGSTTAALAGSTTTNIIAFKGTTQVAATVGTITGQVTGLTTSIAGSGTTNPVITVTVTTSLTATSGVLTIPITVDGQTFSKRFSWTVARAGATGGIGPTGVGISSVTPFYRQLAVGAAVPTQPTGTGNPSGWTTTEPAYTSGTVLYRTERILYDNNTASWTPVSLDSSYAAAAAVEDRTLSRGTDLVTNGTGYLKNNYNFSEFDINLVDVPSGAIGSFYASNTNAGSRHANEIIPIDPSKAYKYSFKARQTVPGATNRMYGFVSPHDSAGLNIQPTNYMFQANTTTTLAAPLNSGDTTVQLTNSAGWYGRPDKPAGASSHFRTLIVWNYTDPNGKTWPQHTYSRLSRSAAWADGGIDPTTHTITLSAPWNASQSMPAGTPVSNGSSAGSFIYMPGVSNVVVPEEWTAYSSVLQPGIMPNATDTTGRGGATWDTGLPPGTAALKVGWLLNYAPSPANAIVGRHAVASVSFSDAAAAQDSANTAYVQAVTADKRVRKANVAPTLADGTGAPVGALWYVYGAATSPGTGTVLRETYEWTGSVWQARGIDRTFLPAVDIGTGTFGDLVGSRLTANSVGAISIKTEEIAASSAFLNNLVVQSGNIASLEANKIVGGTGILSDLTVKSTLTLGDASTNGIIQSYGYTTSAGVKIDKTGIIVNSGSIAASALNIQYGQNIMPAAYADFEFTPNFYTLNMYSYLMVVGVTTGSAKFGNQHIGTIWNAQTANPQLFFGKTATDYNIPVEAGKKYIVSAYVAVSGTVATNLQLRVKWSNATTVQAAALTPTTGSATFVRMSGVVTAPAGVTKAMVYIESPTRTANAGFSVDAVQFEEQMGALTTPSAWTPPSSTSIDGGMLRTGELRSNQTVTVNGVAQPMWSINMEGGMQIGSATIRGNVVVGASGDGTATYMQSYNYSPWVSSTQNGVGWRIRGDGWTEFNSIRVGNNVISKESFTAGTLSVSNLESGNLTVNMNMAVGGKITLGSTSEVYIEQVNNAITVFAPGEPFEDASGNPIPGTNMAGKPMFTLGGTTGGAFIAFDPATQTELGGTNADGTMFTPSLYASEINVGGQDVGEALAQTAGKSIARGYNSVLHSSYTGNTGLVRIRVNNLEANHLYRIFVTFRGRITPDTAYADSALRYTTGTTTPTTSSTLIQAEPWGSSVNNSITEARFQSFTFIPTSNIARVNLLFCVQPSSTGTATTRSYEMDVIDEGLVAASTLVDAFTTPPSEPFDVQENSPNHLTVTQYGDVTSSSYKPYYVRHGQGGSSDYRTYVEIPPALRSMIDAGGTTSVRLRLTQAGDNHGVSPYIGTATALRGTIYNSATHAPSTAMSPGKTGWFTLNSTLLANINAGHDYIVVGRSGSVSDVLVSYYGTGASTTNYRPRVRIIGSQ